MQSIIGKKEKRLFLLTLLVNVQDAQGMEVVLPQQPSRNNNGFMPLSLDHDATDSLDQMEAGRR